MSERSNRFNRDGRVAVTAAIAVSVVMTSSLWAQSPGDGVPAAPVRPEVLARLRPIDAEPPRRHPPTASPHRHVSQSPRSGGQTSPNDRGNVRLTQFALPPPENTPATNRGGQPPISSSGGLPPALASPPASPPRSLAPPPSLVPPQSLAPSPSPAAATSRAVPFGRANDLTPIAPPALTPPTATSANSAVVTPPSGHSGAIIRPVQVARQCGGPALIMPPVVVPGAAPTVVPTIPGSIPATPPPFVPAAAVSPVGSAAPAGALLSLTRPATTVEVGQGVLGQPTAYVPGQPLRNWVRYFTP